MRHVRIVNAALSRRAMILSVIVAVGAGCTSTKVVTTPTRDHTVRIQYRDPLPNLTTHHVKRGEMELNQVKWLYGKIVETRADSVRIQIYSSNPGNRRFNGATAMIARPDDATRAQKWTSTGASASKTFAAVFFPVLILGIGFATSCWC